MTEPATVMARDWTTRIAGLDWPAIERDLDAVGVARTGPQIYMS